MFTQSSERRTAARLKHETHIAIEKTGSGSRHIARMINFSSQGACLASDLYLAPGTQVTLRLAHSPFPAAAEAPETCKAVIKWRKFLDDAVFDYGYGVRIRERAPQPPEPGRPAVESRRQVRTACAVPTLIQGCGQPVRGVIQNASPGGVFIGCPGAMVVGQRVCLAIPLRKRRRLIVRRGVIAHAQPGGVGIRLDPPRRTGRNRAERPASYSPQHDRIAVSAAESTPPGRGRRSGTARLR
ncbi:MAG: PilZ domain-containing protein [Desulfobacterales bacterium]|jgi:hypothetical protein|nr:PilZ domain-containing protein [Desulfobacterales bacterium]